MIEKNPLTLHSVALADVDKKAWYFRLNDFPILLSVIQPQENILYSFVGNMMVGAGAHGMYPSECLVTDNSLFYTFSEARTFSRAKKSARGVVLQDIVLVQKIKGGLFRNHRILIRWRTPQGTTDSIEFGFFGKGHISRAFESLKRFFPQSCEFKGI